MTQKDKVIRYMKQNGSITSFDAFLNLGVTRLSAIVWDIENKDGIRVYRKTESNKGTGTAYTRYSLEEFKDD